jgi:hypothetical protein
MMKKASLLMAFFMLAINITTKAQISGTGFLDINSYSAKYASEPFVSGITVNVYNAATNFAVNDKSLKFRSHKGFQPKKRGFQPKVALNTN